VEVFDSRDSHRVALATVGAGKCVGEMSLMDERPRSANVVALEDTDCLLITRDSFNGLTRRDAEILWGIVPMLVERLRHADLRLTGLAEAGAVPTVELLPAIGSAPIGVVDAVPVRVEEVTTRVRTETVRRVSAESDSAAR